MNGEAITNSTVAKNPAMRLIIFIFEVAFCDVKKESGNSLLFPF